LTASNIATCTIATTRCAAGGVMRGVTKAMAFSFQSAITSANAEGAGVISATATSTLRRLACMLCSLLVECSDLRIAAAILRAGNLRAPGASPVGSLLRRDPPSRRHAA